MIDSASLVASVRVMAAMCNWNLGRERNLGRKAALGGSLALKDQISLRLAIRIVTSVF